MSLIVTNTGEFHQVTGQPIFNYRSDDPSKPVVMTGPIKGTVTVSDGTVYNVSDDYIEVEAGHEGEVAHHIGARHELEGHPSHKSRSFRGDEKDPAPFNPLVDEFHHVCTEHCGASRRSADEHLSDFDARLIAAGHADLIGTDAHSARVAAVRAEYARHGDSAKPVKTSPKDGSGGATMALASATSENQGLDAQTGGTTNVFAYTSLHTATTSTTGASEYAGVTRQATSWNAASGGAKTQSTSLSFTTSGATAVTYMGTFSAVTSGTFGIGAQLGSSVTAATITVAPGADSYSAS